MSSCQWRVHQMAVLIRDAPRSPHGKGHHACSQCTWLAGSKLALTKSKNLKASSREANIWCEISSPPCTEIPNVKLRLNRLTADAGAALAGAVVGASEGATFFVALLLYGDHTLTIREGGGEGTKETTASPRVDGAHASPRGDADGSAPAAAAGRAHASPRGDADGTAPAAKAGGTAGIASTSSIKSWTIAVEVESISSISSLIQSLMCSQEG